MSDKTCGTCANGKPALVRCTVHGDEFPWLKKRNEACDDFCERADSLEQWARDIIDSYARLYSNVSICDNRNNLRKACGNPSSYFKRLKTLGVSL